jgi:hypothetical protein
MTRGLKRGTQGLLALFLLADGYDVWRHRVAPGRGWVAIVEAVGLIATGVGVQFIREIPEPQEPLR